MPVQNHKKLVSFPRNRFYLNEDLVAEIVAYSLTETLKNYVEDYQELYSEEFASVYEGVEFEGIVNMISYYECGFLSEEVKKIVEEFNRIRK